LTKSTVMWTPRTFIILAFVIRSLATFEVFTFLLKTNQDAWEAMDWSKISTICLAGWIDKNLTSFAHSKGAKVVFIANFPKNQLLNSTARKVWIEWQVTYAIENSLDGVNFDFEEELEYGSAESKAYTKLFKKAVAIFHQQIPNSQVSIDVAWSPDNIDGRGYQYKALGRAADLVFVMGYDEQSQMWQNERCQARPNSPIMKTFSGVRKFLQLGIQAHKLVLGVPWYGYRYPCEELIAGVCYIREVPFRGCNCTDAAGIEFAYKDVMNMLAQSNTGRQWDEVAKAPHFDYFEGNQTYQVWYDDPQSLFVKYKIAADMGLGGVGFWTGNFLDYSNKTMVRNMWTVVP